MSSLEDAELRFIAAAMSEEIMDKLNNVDPVTQPIRSVQHFKRLHEYINLVNKLAAIHGVEFAREYMTSNPYLSRGHSKAKMFYSRAALSRRKGWSVRSVGGKPGSRECLRRIQQRVNAGQKMFAKAMNAPYGGA